MRPNFVWTTLPGPAFGNTRTVECRYNPPVCWGLPLPHQPNPYIGLSAHYSSMPEHIPMQCPCLQCCRPYSRNQRHREADGVIVPAVTADFCPACGQGVLDRIGGNRYVRLLAEGHRNR